MSTQQNKVNYSRAMAAPSLTLSLLSQGNNGSYNKPFAYTHGLYAAILLSELIYLQDLFIHKKGKGMVVEEDGYIFLGFFRSYSDLHRDTQIPLTALKRKGNKNNPVNILKKLGILNTASTTMGESFKRVIVYRVDEQATYDHIMKATIKYYQDIEESREEEVEQPDVVMKAIRNTGPKVYDTPAEFNVDAKSEVKSTVKEENTNLHSLSYLKSTTVESRGLSEENGVEPTGYSDFNDFIQTGRLREKGDIVEEKIETVKQKEAKNDEKKAKIGAQPNVLHCSAFQASAVVPKKHSSNNTNPQTAGTLTNRHSSPTAPPATSGHTSPTSTHLPQSQPCTSQSDTSGTNPAGTLSSPEPKKTTKEKKQRDRSKVYSQEVINTLYDNNLALNFTKVVYMLNQYYVGKIEAVDLHSNLLMVTSLPAHFRPSPKDIHLLEKMKDSNSAIVNVEMHANKIIRNDVLIQCNKRKEAFGQLFVGILKQ